MENSMIEFYQVTKENEDSFTELATKKVLRRLDNSYSYLIAATIENNPVGIICFNVAKNPQCSIADINWLYTAPEFRGQGVAKSLVDYVKNMVLKLGISECIFSIPESEEPEEQEGLEELEEFINARVEIREQYEGRAFCHSLKELKEHAGFYSDIRESDVSDFSKVTKSAYLKLINSIPKDIKSKWPVEISTTNRNIDEKLSSAYFQSDGTLGAALLIYRINNILVCPYTMLNKEANKPKNILKVIKNSFMNICNECPDDTEIFFVCVNPATESLLSRLFPGLSCINYHELCIKLK